MPQQHRARGLNVFDNPPPFATNTRAGVFGYRANHGPSAVATHQRFSVDFCGNPAFLFASQQFTCLPFLHTRGRKGFGAAAYVAARTRDVANPCTARPWSHHVSRKRRQLRRSYPTGLLTRSSDLTSRSSRRIRKGRQVPPLQPRALARSVGSSRSLAAPSVIVAPPAPSISFLAEPAPSVSPSRKVCFSRTIA